MGIDEKKALLETLIMKAGEGKIELVLEKNVDAEIHHVDAGGVGFQKVEAGGIGIQNVCAAGKGVAAKAAKKGGRGVKLSDATFTYRYLEESPQRPMLLYQRLMKGNFISPATPPDDFMQLFEGEPSDVKVKWLGNQASLWYLFKLLLDKKYVRKPEGVGPWVVVQSHFVNAKSNMFANFNKQKIPQKQKGLLEKLAELLNPASDEEWGRE